MKFEAIPLNKYIGTEIRCSIQDLMIPGAGEEIRRLLVERGVLAFKELGLTDQQQVTLAKSMGTLRDDGKKGIFKVTLDKDENARSDYLKGSFLWHIDGAHDDVPVFASLLTGVVLSQVGGQTEFANTYVAYEQLSTETKVLINDLKVVHSVETSMRRAGIEPTESNLGFWRSMPDKTHNLVWTHKCGRKSLVIGCHASHIVGMPRDESDELLQELLGWAARPEFVYRHEWTVGDLLIWDNTGVMHRAEPYPVDCGRTMHRTTLMGEEPFSK